ncbi:MAG: hypothetical protein KGL95_06390 [Patescibacteria group bacterium]|nr:hypothetical protein [Patescibacteria group bacterium]
MRYDGPQSLGRPDAGNERLSPIQTLQFAMRHNGYIRQQDQWHYDAPTVNTRASTDFDAQQISFFGPHKIGDFFRSKQIPSQIFERAFNQEAVIETINKYRGIDENLAGRIAYLMGGIVRHLVPEGTAATETAMQNAEDAVGFAARMIKHGGRRSGEAVASAIGMYIISKGKFRAGPDFPEDDERSFQKFEQDITSMAMAVAKDPVWPVREIKDLGLSQVARIRTFLSDGSIEPLPDISEEMTKIQGFPTVGLEYHFFPEDTRITQSFLQRLTLLNISQYQKGSFIQFSREDQGPYELRMNPSLFPVAIANWNLIRRFLPEMNSANFSITLNRQGRNFAWSDTQDTALLNKLQAFGWLVYAGDFDNAPENIGTTGAIGFGDAYLGQTQQMPNGRYNFAGAWSSGKGNDGQFSLSVGYGNNFPILARYLSMALVKPDILDQIDMPRISSLSEAVRFSGTENLLANFQKAIERNDQLREAYNAGFDIEDRLAA